LKVIQNWEPVSAVVKRPRSSWRRTPASSAHFPLYVLSPPEPVTQINNSHYQFTTDKM